eukprot:CAMPEP_0177679840 /NCGR_PEP_ID=MMETSP0447-20121125/29833_1 /TAXON_ID=0 /ORGANISM="Stygamoeba regulata, Strain BSH-02190019" /LENGTH=102 /DNA_ID=CAMNT_0019189089 /DNA_START=397 /DNA_END=706 /DNA_ORIENTATION=+
MHDEQDVAGLPCDGGQEAVVNKVEAHTLVGIAMPAQGAHVSVMCAIEGLELIIVGDGKDRMISREQRVNTPEGVPVVKKDHHHGKGGHGKALYKCLLCFILA